ncbi:MAG: PIG-L family deacetylase [Bacteroidia bacterium]|jgi:LmbE family N-acetylglucosaminyl deacetylase|nr:PIG-L family deacetylase [Bacteroidia bacterium]
MNRPFFGYLLIIFISAHLHICTSVFAQAPRSYTSSEILLQLKKLNTVGSVLYIAAHPDDENTRLIAYLANEKCLRTGYLSLTRGDGGQNLIGPEQGVELGVIRTQELLAARRIDGGEQYFTRAYDFGFSKSPEETLQKWNKDSVLSDMVWVIRNFRPDIIITRFATDGSGGHGHHTTSAILAEEAFDAAGDPTRFPEQLQYVDVWKPRRLFWNVSTRFQNPNADMSAYIKLDVGGYNPLLGKSYGEIAAESRSMHKSQGFGSAKQRGEYFEYFKPIKGDTTGLKDIFQGIDFSWKRVKGGEKIGRMIETIIKDYKIESPEESIKMLIKTRNELITRTDTRTPTVQNKLIQIEKNFELLTGIFYELQAKESSYSIEESVKYKFSFVNRSTFPISISNGSPHRDTKQEFLLHPIKDSLYFVDLKCQYYYNDQLHNGTYWLEKGITNSIFNVNDKSTLGMPEKYVQSPMNLYVGLDGKVPFSSFNQPSIQYKWVDPEKGELYRPVVITPPVMINLSEDVLIFDKNEEKKLTITLKAGRDSVNGKYYIDIPNGWEIVCDGDGEYDMFLSTKEHIVPDKQRVVCEFAIEKKGNEKTYIVKVKPINQSTNQRINIYAVVDNQTYNKGIKEIKYDHIPIQTLFPEAEVKLVKLDVVKESKRIGYIPGAGDEVQACLSQLGYEVTTLTDDKLANENLSQYDAIVTGVRAYNTNEKLPSFKQKLMDYVAAGGNLIVQYNTNSWAGPLSSDIGPYKFKITRNRITDEEAKVNFLLPNHPVLNTPNKITEKDFEGWIQERSIYHAGEWDSNYVAPISMTDPYEMTVGGVSPKGKPDNGALIIAKHGKGNFVYTGLVFFRELPAGVPGAYRLMVNLIELGK